MRIVTFSAAAAIAVLASDAFAQTATPEEGYTGAYQPAGTPPTTPYSTGPLPKEDRGPGRDVEDPDGSTKQSKRFPAVQPLMRPTARQLV